MSAVGTTLTIYGGGLAEVQATKLDEISIWASLERADLEATQVDESGHGQNAVGRARSKSSVPRYGQPGFVSVQANLNEMLFCFV